MSRKCQVSAPPAPHRCVDAAAGEHGLTQVHTFCGPKVRSWCWRCPPDCHRCLPPWPLSRLQALSAHPPIISQLQMLLNASGIVRCPIFTFNCSFRGEYNVFVLIVLFGLMPLNHILQKFLIFMSNMVSLPPAAPSKRSLSCHMFFRRINQAQAPSFGNSSSPISTNKWVFISSSRDLSLFSLRAAAGSCQQRGLVGHPWAEVVELLSHLNQG